MPAWIRLYGRLLQFLRPHLAPLSGAVLFMALYAALASFSLALVVPFTQIVLQGDLGGSPTATAPDTTSSTAPGTTPAAAPATTAESATRVTDALGGYDLRQQIETRFYQLVHGRDRTETMRRFALALLAVFLLKNICWYAQSFLVVRVEQNVIRDIRERLFAHTQRLSFDYFAQQHSGALISRLTNDIELIKGAIANGIADLLRQSLLLLAYLVTVLIANWQLFLFAVAVLPPNLWLIDRLGGTLRRSTRFSQARLGRLTAVLSETFSGMRVVKACGTAVVLE